MVLFCPRCGTRYVDQPDPATGWLNESHRSHLWHLCGNIWRPADIVTVGLGAIATTGRLDVDQGDTTAWRTVVQECTDQFRFYERNDRQKALAAPPEDAQAAIDEAELRDGRAMRGPVVAGGDRHG